MNFIDWMNMNMAVDIACVVYAIALTWKLRKVGAALKECQDLLDLTIRNPQSARRSLKKKQ